MPEAAGQLNMYLNYYREEVNDPDDNPSDWPYSVHR